MNGWMWRIVRPLRRRWVRRQDAEAADVEAMCAAWFEETGLWPQICAQRPEMAADMRAGMLAARRAIQ